LAPRGERRTGVRLGHTEGKEKAPRGRSHPSVREGGAPAVGRKGGKGKGRACRVTGPLTGRAQEEKGAGPRASGENGRIWLVREKKKWVGGGGEEGSWASASRPSGRGGSRGLLPFLLFISFFNSFSKGVFEQRIIKIKSNKQHQNTMLQHECIIKFLSLY